MKFTQANAIVAFLACSCRKGAEAALRNGGSFDRGSQSGNPLLGQRAGLGGNRGNFFSGNRPGIGNIEERFDAFDLDVDFELTEITCDAEFACETRRDQVAGTFVCRTIFNPITGAERTQSLCIEPDQAWPTDQCGCCSDDCPERPEFTEITCDNTELDLDSLEGFPKRLGSRFGETREIVCRTVFDPFTGEPVPVTLPIPSDKALEGDTCGCCDGKCPELGGGSPFSRPDFVEKTCSAEELITCDLRKRGDEDEAVGQFVCRTRYNPLTGDAKQEAMCISEDRAVETDECGCCGEDCPVRPSRVDIDCTSSDVCELPNGEDGVFVCRSFFNPLDGEPEEASLCIPSDRAWENDTCGCCTEAGCP